MMTKIKAKDLPALPGVVQTIRDLEPIATSDDGRPVYRRGDVVAMAHEVALAGYPLGVFEILRGQDNETSLPHPKRSWELAILPPARLKTSG